MKLLEAAKLDIREVTYGVLYDIQSAIEDRLDWQEDREPESDGQVHDDWQDKCDDLEDYRFLMTKTSMTETRLSIQNGKESLMILSIINSITKGCQEL